MWVYVCVRVTAVVIVVPKTNNKTTTCPPNDGILSTNCHFQYYITTPILFYPLVNYITVILAGGSL
jgi:hypothetical protein